MSRPTQTQPLPDDDDPLNPKVAASALDFLLIELVPLAQRITEQLHAREQALQEEYRRSRTFNQTASKTLVGSQQSQKKSQDGDGVEGQGAVGVSADGSSAAAGTGGGEGSGVTSLGFPVMSEKTRESVFWRLDGIGYRVGQGLVER